MAEGYLAAGRGEVALVVSTEKMSAIVDWEDRSTCVLFGDGAGAAVVKPANGSDRGILSSHLRSDGNLAQLLYRPAGGARSPAEAEVLARRDHLVRMEGREVFKNAVRSMAEACQSRFRTPGSRPTTWTSWFRTRPTSASSRPPRSTRASPWRRCS